ncbi:hypothetical protein [Psychrobacter glacincola]|uniref:hypothetical protein n=1 Tax=Psychrobacter glacincola TaxID=56810 RepID=UPI0039B0F1B2
MAISESAIEQFDREFGIKQLTALDNTGLYCNSNHYSKHTKIIILAQQKKVIKKAKRGSHDR